MGCQAPTRRIFPHRWTAQAVIRTMRRMNMNKWALLLVTGFAVAGCGSKPTAVKQVSTALPASFDEMNHDQRIEFMKTTVVPAMAPLFQKHDAEKFKDFGCKTCHGAAAADGQFTMPNEELPVLDFADMSKWKPADLEWMNKEIKPTMAKLLGEAEYSDTNPKGFGCLECHTMKK